MAAMLWETAVFLLPAVVVVAAAGQHEQLLTLPRLPLLLPLLLQRLQQP
jgi:hypothetical protein